MGKGGNNNLGIGNVQETLPQTDRRAEAPPEGGKNGSTLKNINMFVRLVFRPSPCITHDVPPGPPVGGDTLARVSVGMAGRGHQPQIMTAVGLTTIEVFHETTLERQVRQAGRGGRNWGNRGNDGSGWRSVQRTQTVEKVAQQPGHHPTMEGVAQQTELLQLETGRIGRSDGRGPTALGVKRAKIEEQLTLQHRRYTPSVRLSLKNEAPMRLVLTWGGGNETNPLANGQGRPEMTAVPLPGRGWGLDADLA